MPLFIRRHLAAAVLAFLSAMASPAHAQLATTVRFYYISQDPVSGEMQKNPEAVSLTVPLRVAYRRSSTARWEEMPIQGGIIPVYSYEYTRLHVRFENNSLHNKRIQVENRSSGRFRAASGSPQIVEISEPRDLGVMPVSISTQSDNTPLAVNITKYEGHSLDPGSSGEVVFRNLRVVSFAELNRQASSADPAEKIRAYADMLTYFSSFKETKYNALAGAAEIRAALSQINNELRALESQLGSEANSSLEAKLLYYQVFGAESRPLTEPYRDRARQMLADADKQAWAAVGGNYAAAQAYVKTFGSIDGYTCLHCAEAKNILPHTPPPPPPPPSFDCNQAYNRAVAQKSKALLVQFLNNCSASAPPSWTENAKRLLAEMARPDQCSSLFTQMLRESSDRQAILGWVERLRNECMDALDMRQLDVLDSLSYLYAKPQLEHLSEPQRMGSEKYVYLARFRKNTFLSIAAIDGSGDSSALHSGSMRWNWQYPDSLLQLVVADNRDHRVLIQARNGDTLSLNITSRAFEGSVQQNGNLLEIQLTNGMPPFRVEFIQGGKKYLMLLPDARASIRLDSLPPAYSGTYELVIKDRYQRQAQIQPGGSVTIERPFRLSLWHWLLLPFLALAGGLAYRNQEIL